MPVPSQIGRIRNLRILSLPRKRLKRGGQTPPVVTYRILAENGNILTTESSTPIRLEQS
jgi:hypothetical protein